MAKSLTQCRLAAPFDPANIGWKPRNAKDGQKVWMAYIDARDVMNRLDEVVGIDGWQDSFTLYSPGGVECRLTVRFFPGTTPTTKTDFGAFSDQPDLGDKTKAAYSDALKRAASKFGIGRYLYYLPSPKAAESPPKDWIVKNAPWAVPATREKLEELFTLLGDGVKAADLEARCVELADAIGVQSYECVKYLSLRHVLNAIETAKRLFAAPAAPASPAKGKAAAKKADPPPAAPAKGKAPRPTSPEPDEDDGHDQYGDEIEM